MRPLRVALSVSMLALLLAAAPAEAKRRGGDGARARSTNLAFGLGADYLVDSETGEFQATLALETPIARQLTVGGRFGVLLTSDPTKVGAPIDFRLRLRTHRLYIDGLIGPWLIFDSGDTLRFHGGVGVGILTGGMSLGLEAGFLDDDGMIGLRLAFSL